MKYRIELFGNFDMKSGDPDLCWEFSYAQPPRLQCGDLIASSRMGAGSPFPVFQVTDSPPIIRERALQTTEGSEREMTYFYRVRRIAAEDEDEA